MIAHLLPVFFILTTLSAHGYMLGEDKVGGKFWIALTVREKEAFLLGYRHGIGKNSHEPSKEAIARGKAVRFTRVVFTDVIKLVDDFYSVDKQKILRLGAAIDVALLRLREEPEERIDARIKAEFSRALTAY